MSDPTDPNFEAVERRLTARAGLAPPVRHRDQVLAAVRDTLEEKEEKVPATKSGQSAQKSHPASPDLVAGTFWGGTFLGIDAGSTAALFAMAVSAALVIVAPWVAVTRLATAMAAEPRIVAQARAAGIDFPVERVAMSCPAREASSRAAMSDLPGRRPDAWRLRTLLTGDL